MISTKSRCVNLAPTQSFRYEPRPFLLSEKTEEDRMKEGIHPEYPAATVACACGSSFVTRSTRGDFQVDVARSATRFTRARKNSLTPRVVSIDSASAMPRRRVLRASRRFARRDVTLSFGRMPQRGLRNIRRCTTYPSFDFGTGGAIRPF